MKIGKCITKAKDVPGGIQSIMFQVPSIDEVGVEYYFAVVVRVSMQILGKSLD
jgi:hypothetical protein